MSLATILSLIGGITGPLGLVISILVFFRDRPRIAVSVAWEMAAFPKTPGYPDKFASVTAVNLGRRPAYISHFTAWQKGSTKAWLIPSTVPGQILSEGSAPYSAIIDEKAFIDDAVPWWLLRFAVSGAGGKRYYSPWLERPPKWAEGQSAPKWATRWNRRKNQINRLFAVFN